MLPHEIGSLPWKVPEANEGESIVMLESLELMAVPERCLVPVSSLHEGERAGQEIRRFHGFGADGSRRDRSYTAKHGGGLTGAATDNHSSHAKDAMKSLEAMKFAPRILNNRRASTSTGSSRGGGSSRRSSVVM